MSCPDWPTLIDRREHDAEGEFLWDRALEHLDGCDACRDAAYAAEPTLIFRRLPKVTPEASEIDAMQNAVAALRRTQPMVEPSRQRRSRRRFGSLALMRAAAALAVVSGSLLLFNLLGPDGLGPTPVGDGQLALAGDPAPVAASPPRQDLQIEIHLLRASKTERGAPVGPESEPSSELLTKLREVLDFEAFQVLGQKDFSSRHGSGVVADLGQGFTASFKTADVRQDGTVLLRDFEMAKEPVVKSGPGDKPVQVLLLAELEVTCESPVTVTVAHTDPDRDALVLAVTCWWETASATL